MAYDYTNIDNPYDNSLQRSDNIPPPSQQENVNEMPVKTSGNMDSLWINSFIRSTNWLPKKRGFYIDGETGYAEFSDVFVGNVIQVITGGTIGGWTITATELTSGNVHIQSDTQRILMGAATEPLVGNGIFLGLDGADYEFRVGNPPDGDFIHWDGSSMEFSLKDGTFIVGDEDGGNFIEIDGAGGTISLWSLGNPRVSLDVGTGGIGFNAPNGAASGLITGLGTNSLTIVTDPEAGIPVFDASGIYPFVTGSLDLGKSGERWDTIYLVNSPDVSSDRRLKSDIEPISYGIETIMEMNPVKFKVNDEERLGFIADEMFELVPEVTKNVGLEEIMASIRYEEVIPVLVKAIQDLQNQVNKLKGKAST